MSKKIPLTQGKYAIVDDADYEWLMEWQWCAAKMHPRSGNAEYVYAATHMGSSSLVLMHRAIMDATDGKHVDHINGNRLDNRRKNLRIVTPSMNLANSKKQKNNTSGYMGVSRDRGGRWRTQLNFQKKRYYGGLHDTPEEAARAYDELAKEIHGEFATLNFPKD